MLLFDQPVTIELMLNRLDCKCENKEGRAGNMRKYLDVSLFYIINFVWVYFVFVKMLNQL